MSDLVGIPNCWFSHAAAHRIILRTRKFWINGIIRLISIILYVVLEHINQSENRNSQSDQLDQTTLCHNRKQLDLCCVLRGGRLCTSHLYPRSLPPLWGPGNSRVFNFSIFKTRLKKAWHCRVIFVVKFLLNISPCSPKADSNMEQQLVVVLMKTYERGV